MQKRRTSKGLADWMVRLNLPVTGNSCVDLETKRQHDIDTGKVRRLKKCNKS